MISLLVAVACALASAAVTWFSFKWPRRLYSRLTGTPLVWFDDTPHTGVERLACVHPDGKRWMVQYRGDNRLLDNDPCIDKWGWINPPPRPEPTLDQLLDETEHLQKRIARIGESSEQPIRSEQSEARPKGAQASASSGAGADAPLAPDGLARRRAARPPTSYGSIRWLE